MQRDSKRICKRYRLRLVLDHESPESHEYLPCHDLQDSSDSCSQKHSRLNYINLTTNLPNQTNHLICRLNQKKNPSIIPFVQPRHNQNINQKEKIKKRIRVKTPLKIGDTPWAFFDSSSVAADSQSAMQQIELRVKNEETTFGDRKESQWISLWTIMNLYGSQLFFTFAKTSNATVPWIKHQIRQTT